MEAPGRIDDDVVGRLQMAFVRLARLIRQQDHTGMPLTTSAMYATIMLEGELTLGELAAIEGVAPPTVTRVVAELEAAGLIERRVDESDRRVSRVRLTELGQSQMAGYRAEVTAWFRGMLDTLADEEQDDLLRALGVIEHLTTGLRSRTRLV